MWQFATDYIWVVRARARLRASEHASGVKSTQRYSPVCSMNYVWTLPWRSSCTGLRRVQATFADVPKALFGGQLGGAIPRSPGQIWRQHAPSTQPLPQQTRCFSSGNVVWTKNRTSSIIAQSWVGARYKSSSASSRKHRPRSKQPPANLSKRELAQARLPEDSKDVDAFEGVRFRIEDLSEKEITSIFGPEIDKDEGNRVLRILHGQRLSGTLDQGLAVPIATAYVQSLVATGLEWLRAHYPVDEDAAIMARIEREQAEEERELLEDATRLGILRPGTTDKSRLYGPSGLDAIREHYESQPVAEPKPKAEEKGVEIGKLEPVRQKRELCTYSFIQYHVILVTKRPGPELTSEAAHATRHKYWSDRAIKYPGEEIPKLTIVSRKLQLPTELETHAFVVAASWALCCGHVCCCRPFNSIRTELHPASQISTIMARHASCSCHSHRSDHCEFHHPGAVEISAGVAVIKQVLSEHASLPKRDEHLRKCVFPPAIEAFPC